MMTGPGCFGIPRINSLSTFVGASYSGATSAGTNNANSALQFSNKLYDTHNIVNATTGIITPPFPGIWRLWLEISYSSNSVGFRAVGATQSGSASTAYGGNNQASSSSSGVFCTAFGDFVIQPGDVITLVTFQNAGGTFPPSSGNLMIQWLAPTPRGY